jgi:hypothetical protein
MTNAKNDLADRPGVLSAFAIRRSPFAIRHSAFGIRHSAFVIRHSAFVIRHSAFGIDALIASAKRHRWQDPHPPLPQDPHPGPVGFEHSPWSAQPPCFTPLPFGSS